jgi:hypothetical protein
MLYITFSTTYLCQEMSDRNYRLRAVCQVIQTDDYLSNSLADLTGTCAKLEELRVAASSTLPTQVDLLRQATKLFRENQWSYRPPKIQASETLLLSTLSKKNVTGPGSFSEQVNSRGEAVKSFSSFSVVPTQ